MQTHEVDQTIMYFFVAKKKKLVKFHRNLDWFTTSHFNDAVENHND